MAEELYILVVEDSPTQAMLLKRLLVENGYTVSISPNGKEAIDSIYKRRPTLIISDIVMPVMDGYEMCHSIKTDQSLREIPVILLTSLTDPEDVIRGLEAKADVYITKPYDETNLLLKVASILENPVMREDKGELEITLGKKQYIISSNRREILNLLLFTYESAIHKNRQLIKVQNELKKLNEQLEDKVEDRTAELRAEINERRRVEQSLKEANEKLKELDVLKSDFLSTVSHELRTPLGIMREGVSLCLEGVAGEITETQKDLLTDTKESIDRLTRLITDLLDISKIEAKKIQLRRKILDLGEIVKKICHDFEIQAGDKGVQIRHALPKKNLKLYIDGDKINQIFNNLISNAIRYTEKGGEISIHVTEKENCVECLVRDSGSGIAEKDLPKLFSKFEQVGRVDGPGYRGTGLGLAIVKGLIEKHGGRIWVKSEVGKGTVFGFELEKVPPPKILVVDDEPSIIHIVKKYLSKDGYRILEAGEGEAAIRCAQKERPSLIILDIVLPGMNGYEILGRLKQDDRTDHIPVLILSAFSVDQDKLNQVGSHSAIPVLTKPIRADDLRSHVREKTG
jgi:two-component system sensor histidine kinase/response regulator